MEIFHFGKQEFQLLKSTEKDRVEFQRKFFVRDIDVSQRAYPQVVTALKQQSDEATACLMVEMDGYYTVWHEVKISQPPVALANLDASVDQDAFAQPFTQGISRGTSAQRLSASPTLSQPLIPQSAPADSPLTVHSSQKMTASIAKVVQDVVEKALAHNTHIVPEHLVDALKAEIATLAQDPPVTLEDLVEALNTELPNPKLALQLAQKVFSETGEREPERPRY